MSVRVPPPRVVKGKSGKLVLTEGVKKKKKLPKGWTDRPKGFSDGFMDRLTDDGPQIISS